MPQEDDKAAELQHAEEVGLVIFPSTDQSTEIVEPSEEPLDSPALELLPLRLADVHAPDLRWFT